MMELRGVHGTCRSYSYQIEKKGFRPGDGRRGAGIYFWAYRDPNIEAEVKELAIGWWRQSLSKNSYRNAGHKGCSLIYVRLIGVKNLLDFEDLDVHESFVAFANEAVSKNITTYKQEACRIYDLFVKMMEEEVGQVFDVLLVKVPPPGNEFYTPPLPLDLVGYPPCLVVKHPEVIHIDRVEREDQKKNL